MPGQERRARRCIYMQKNAGENNARVSEDVIVWLIRLLKGLLIGIGAILPGLSGGVLAVIFGIYDKLIVFLAHLRTNFIAQIKFFLAEGKSVVDEILKLGVKAGFKKVDVSVGAEVEEFFEAGEDFAGGKIDFAINNAGVIETTSSH